MEMKLKNLWKPLLTQFSLSEGYIVMPLHNGYWTPFFNPGRQHNLYLSLSFLHPYFVVLPNPPFLTAVASSSTVIPYSTKIPCIKPVPFPSSTVLFLIGIIRQFRKDMTFIIRIEIIAVNNSYRIIQLQTELESKSASRIAFEHPVFFHFHTDPCRDLDRLSGSITKSSGA